MIADRFLRIARKALKIDDSFGTSFQHARVMGQEASDLIRATIERGQPALIARFGWTELDCMLNYLLLKDVSLWDHFRHRCHGSPFTRIFTDDTKLLMNRQSGFFPCTNECLQAFVDLMVDDMKSIDVLASWMKQERFVLPLMKAGLQTISLEDLPPFHHPHPWSEALHGRRVLVVHPFKKSILSQYERRELLFKDKRVLPDFHLEVVQAVQSLGLNGTQYIGGQKVEFATWFDALEHMKNEVAQRSFDVAIVGCGAYGLPLAAAIKKMGKIAVHLGGTTQCLFGIKGRRWEEEYNYQEKYYNDFWVRPDAEEKRDEFLGVDNGAYW